MTLLSGLLPAFLGAAVATLLTALAWARPAARQASQQQGRADLLEQALAAEQAGRQQAEAGLRQREAEIAEHRQQTTELSVRAAQATSDLANQVRMLDSLRDELAQLKIARMALTEERQRLATHLAGAEMALRKEQESSAEKLALLTQAREQMGQQFRLLANDVLEEKSKQFTEQNKVSLGHLLDPLKTQLTDFKGTVERVYGEEGKERFALAEQVKQLAALNAQISADAVGLTNALKGSAKTQGNWGEMVLERILEAGGLRKGHEYRVQENHRQADGSHVIPDVILHLPEGRHLVIDAKVSLLDYNEHVNHALEEIREQAALRHLGSVRAHIKGLSAKNYSSLHSLNSIDFVIMFVPIEPAFMLAIGRDQTLWMQAWEKNVLLVSPSTLLFVVRTVSHLWKQEQQRGQWQEIARQGSELYNKFSGFVTDLSKLGDQLQKAQQSYDQAFSKLKSGRGNLINKAESLRKLGRFDSVNKLPEALVSEAADDEDAPSISTGEKSDQDIQPAFFDLAVVAEQKLAGG